MSSGFKINWLNKKKVIADYPVIDLEETYAPPAHFYKADDHKPVIDYRRVIDVPRRVSPWQELSLLFAKAVQHEPAMPQGRYFIRTLDGTYRAGCIMGAVLLEMDGGQERAEKIYHSGLNNASWMRLAQNSELIPARFRDHTLTLHIQEMQSMNDRGLPWSLIAMNFESRARHYSRAAA